jgi:hypothetical protein
MGGAFPDFSGMTTSERLSAAGLADAWDRAITSRDRHGAITILSQVNMADQAGELVDTVLAKPAFYGFPRTPSKSV